MASSSGEQAPPTEGAANTDMELRPRPSSSTTSTTTNAAGKRPAASLTRPPATKKPRLIEKTHTTPLAGFLQPAYHPFTKAEVPRVRERFAAVFSTLTLSAYNTWNIMQDLVKLPNLAYRAVGDPMSYWITNIQSELMQREWTGAGVIPTGKCYHEVVIEHACAHSLNVLAELIGDSPEASRNPVVDRVELLVYNKQRANNRAAHKGSKTRLSRWNQQHGKTPDEEELEEAVTKIASAHSDLRLVATRKAEIDKQVAVVEHSHAPFAMIPHADRPNFRDLTRACDGAKGVGSEPHTSRLCTPSKCSFLCINHPDVLVKRKLKAWRDCEAQAKTETEIALGRQKKVWGFVDAVTKNQTWLKNKVAQANQERDKLSTTVAALKALPHVIKHKEGYAREDNVLGEYRAQIAVWEELAARLECMRVDGEKRLKELSKMSTEETNYVKSVNDVSTSIDDAIKQLKDEKKDDDDDAVVCTGTQTRTDKNKALLADAVDLTSDGE